MNGPFQKDKKTNARKKSSRSRGDPKGKLPLPVTKNQFHFSIWYFLIVFIALTILNQFIVRTPEETIDFSIFKQKIHAGQIKRVELGEKYYTGFPYTSEEMKKAEKTIIRQGPKPVKQIIFQTIPVNDPGFVPLLDSVKVEYYAKSGGNSAFFNLIFAWILPFAILIFIWQFFLSRMGKLGNSVMAFGQSRAQLVAESDIKTTFHDVAGADEAKEELLELVDFLKTPQKYTSIGGKIPKGVLLVGPPGTGKTLLARAVAGEAHVPFFRISGAEFVELFVGMGASRVRDMFHQAREKAPCIIFIDELDAIGKSRMPGVIGGNDEREQTLNQLLVEMDGFDSRTGVIILAATNRPEVLDPALLRPGRFDRQVLVDRPDLLGRKAILEIHAKGVKLDGAVNLEAVARGTAGLSGADLANIVNEAALLAVRAGRGAVEQKDFEEAIEKSMAGLQKKSRLVNQQERQIVAYHETGHALVAALTPGTDPVQKITIVPRGLAALGYTLQTPTEDRYLMTRDELIAKIDVLMGGRAAEQLVFGQVSTGAANDLVKATDIAKRMMGEFGMSEKFQNVVLHAQRNSIFPGDGLAFNRPREYSESTQQYIDEQIAGLIKQRYSHVIETLGKKLDTLKKVAARLLEKESIGGEEFQSMMKE
jgi:cell division protease FtsH